jgi:oligopeptide/dipeptide ABC transporter ATP-binding protein
VTGALLSVEGLEVVYHRRHGLLQALHDVSFTVQPGEIVGVVGESGCGKSTLSSALMRLLPPNGEITDGRILFQDRDLAELDDEALRRLRGPGMAMIFTIGTQLVDALRAHSARRETRKTRARAVEMLARVGIPDAIERMDSYPHEFSGGMRQRIMIAMTLLLEPALLIADEATSSLDVTLEAQILELLRSLRAERGTAILFVSHDLGVVAQLCDRVVVMYAGRAVEEADVYSLYEHPLHPYTQGLLGAVPSRRRRGQRLETIPGRVPALSDLPPGCKFHGRCRYAQDVCRDPEPRLVEREGRHVRCNIYIPESGYVPGAGADAEPSREPAS